MIGALVRRNGREGVGVEGLGDDADFGCDRDTGKRRDEEGIGGENVNDSRKKTQVRSLNMKSVKTSIQCPRSVYPGIVADPV
jgi:hypothetical protein